MKPVVHAMLSLSLLLSVTAGAQIIKTIAGTPGVQGNTGNGIPAVGAVFHGPYSMATDDAGNIYLADYALIRKIDKNGIIRTIAGTGVPGNSGDGGLAIAAKVDAGFIAVDKAGNIYFTGGVNGVIRKIALSGIISTIAGNGSVGFSGDGGPATAAQLSPGHMVVDDAGNIYVSDYHNGRIRKINTAGIITTIAGNGVRDTVDETGPATTIPIIPFGLALDIPGNLYVSDNNSRVRKIDKAGIITTIAGTGIHGYRGDGGPATEAWLNVPLGIDVDEAGNIYIADAANHRIRMINTAGIISTIAGTGVEGHSGDGGQAVAAQISYPVDVVVDRDEAVYFPDYDYFTLRKISACPFVLKPSLTIAPSTLSPCSGLPVMFTASLINGGNAPCYQWKVNGINTGTNSSRFVTNTLKDGDVVSCMLADSIDCVIPAFSNSLHMHVRTSPTIVLNPEVTILPGQTATLKPGITGVINAWQWTPATRLSDPAIANPVASPLTTTTYQLKVMSDEGCEATAQTTVIVYRKIQMPTAFTPNGDYKNELYKIPAGTTFSLKSFTIYNRWGELVFRTNNIRQGWDGTQKGVPANAGLYVYAIVGSDQQKEVVFRGTVLLIK